MSYPATSAAAVNNPQTATILEPDATDDMTGDWEEPHPGQRLACSGATAGRGGRHAVAGSGQLYGGGRHGVAAKGYRTSHQNGKLVRKNIRLRVRSTGPKPVFASQHMPGAIEERDDSSSTTGSMYPSSASTAWSMCPSSPTSTIKLLPPTTRAATRGSEFGTSSTCPAHWAGDDGDEVAQALAAHMALSGAPHRLCDLSNLLDMTAGADDEQECEADLEDDIMHEASTKMEDMYGWEEAFDRKTVPDNFIPGSERVCPHVPALQDRRNDNRRGLLHRVFSMASGPGDAHRTGGRSNPSL